MPDIPFILQMVFYFRRQGSWLKSNSKRKSQFTSFRLKWDFWSFSHACLDCQLARNYGSYYTQNLEIFFWHISYFSNVVTVPNFVFWFFWLVRVLLSISVLECCQQEPDFSMKVLERGALTRHHFFLPNVETPSTMCLLLVIL